MLAPSSLCCGDPFAASTGKTQKSTGALAIHIGVTYAPGSHGDGTNRARADRPGDRNRAALSQKRGFVGYRGRGALQPPGSHRGPFHREKAAGLHHFQSVAEEAARVPRVVRAADEQALVLVAYGHRLGERGQRRRDRVGLHPRHADHRADRGDVAGFRYVLRFVVVSTGDRGLLRRPSSGGEACRGSGCDDDGFRSHHRAVHAGGLRRAGAARRRSCLHRPRERHFDHVQQPVSHQRSDGPRGHGGRRRLVRLARRRGRIAAAGRQHDAARRLAQHSTEAKMSFEYAYELAASAIRVGRGVTREVGMDLAELGAKRVMVLTDPNLRRLQPVATVEESLRDNGISYALYDRVRVEPTDLSFKDAIEFAARDRFDAFVAVGGGSTIDTAKATNLYATYPADFLDYVNAPIGKGKPVPGPLRPLIAIPTTAGTGSETTGVAIFDFVERKAKTGIAHRYLRPTLGIVDPDNTRTMPPAVAAATGLDVLSHALESYTAIPYTSRPRPERPLLRPAYQGANPISDIWALRALEIVAEFLPRAVADPSDDEARAQMLLASSIAGIGFRNAGVHLPHGMSYPVAGMVKSFRPPGYSTDHPLIPHGMSVILHTPAVVCFTAPACPQRHLSAAAALGCYIDDPDPAKAGDILAGSAIH